MQRLQRAYALFLLLLGGSYLVRELIHIAVFRDRSMIGRSINATLLNVAYLLNFVAYICLAVCILCGVRKAHVVGVVTAAAVIWFVFLGTYMDAVRVTHQPSAVGVIDVVCDFGARFAFVVLVGVVTRSLWPRAGIERM